MTIIFTQELLIAVIFMPLSVVVLIIILVCGAVQVYRCANNSGPAEGEEKKSLPRLTGDSRRNSPHLASEFVEASKTTSTVRTIRVTDDISIVGDAAFAGTLESSPVASGIRGLHQEVNFACPPQDGGGESNTLFAVEFYNQTQNHFTEQGDTSRVSFYERPTSEVFKLACCFGCCLWKRRAGHLSDSNEPKLVNFDKLQPKAFVDHTIPKQFLCEKPSISLTDLVRIQKANYRVLMESTLMSNHSSTRESVQSNCSAHTSVDAPEGTGSRDNYYEITESRVNTLNIGTSSDAVDSVINIPEDNETGNSQLDTSAQNTNNHVNICELSVIHEATSPINLSSKYTVIIHAQRTPDSALITPSCNSINVENDELYTSFNSIPVEMSLDDEPQQSFLNSYSSGASVDTSETSFSSRESLLSTAVSDSANRLLPNFVERSKSTPCQINMNLKAASLASMWPTDLDDALETLANYAEDSQAGLSNEEVNDHQAVSDDELHSNPQHTQQLPDLLPPQATVQHGEESDDDSLNGQENRTATIFECVNQGYEHDCAEEDKHSETEYKPVDHSCHYVTILGKTFESYYV